LTFSLLRLTIIQVCGAIVEELVFALPPILVLTITASLAYKLKYSLTAVIIGAVQRCDTASPCSQTPAPCLHARRDASMTGTLPLEHARCVVVLFLPAAPRTTTTTTTTTATTTSSS